MIVSKAKSSLSVAMQISKKRFGKIIREACVIRQTQIVYSDTYSIYTGTKVEA